MIYDPAHVTVVGAVRVPKAPTLKAAIAAQESLSPADGPGWFLRDRERVMPTAPSPKRVRADYSRKKK